MSEVLILVTLQTKHNCCHVIIFVLKQGGGLCMGHISQSLDTFHNSQHQHFAVPWTLRCFTKQSISLSPQFTVHFKGYTYQ